MNYASLFLASLALGQSESSDDPIPDALAEIELVIVEDGVPVSDVAIFVNDDEVAATGAQGTAIFRMPSGRQRLKARRGGETVLDLDLLTDQGEIVLIIATLRQGSEPELLIENSGRDSILAQERQDLGVRDPDTARERTPSQAPGALRGAVVSAEDQQPIAKAQVFFSGITVEVITDQDGRYEAELPAGTYSVSVVHPRFSAQTLENIRVIPEREVTVNIELNPAGIRLQDYVVTAPYVEGSVASVVEQQRAAAGVSDVLGAAQISATGDNNAAQALARVTGLTVEDGKFVLIRGQPSRFTLALFNGSPLPSPEPLQRVVPLDLFPTGVLEGIQVQKSYTPDQPGAFGAGLVELNTRGVPAEGFFKVSLRSSTNSITSFEDGLSYTGGRFDWLGFDDGTRALPDQVSTATEEGTAVLRGESAVEVAPSFPNNLATRNRSLPPNFGVGLSGAGNIALPGDGSLGVIATARFSNRWQRQARIQRAFRVVGDRNQVSGERLLDTRQDFEESRTDNEATLSGLLTVAAEWDDHQWQLNTFVVNQSQQRTQLTTGRTFGSTPRDIRRSLLSWIERFLVAQQLVGRNDFDFIQLDYRALVAQARRDAPDRREYEYSAGLLDRTFIVRDPTGLTRRYSFVIDTQYGMGIDLSSDELAPEEWWFRLKPKIGVALNRVTRDAGAQTFQWLPTGSENRDEPNPEVLFEPSGTGDTLKLTDLSIRGADDYTANSEVLGYYGMIDLELGDIARIVTGVRQETAEFQVDTFQASAASSEVVTTGFDRSESLPSASLTVFPLDNVQLRAAYGRTVSRPVFNELTPSFFFDPDSGQQFIGNPDLGPTVIDGYDLRLEWYPSTTESASIGVFRKDYTEPLENTVIPVGGGDFSNGFQNAEAAEVQGLEFGGRFELGRVRDWLSFMPEILDAIYFSSNVAFLTSEVSLAEQGRATDRQRPLQGQADLVFNAQLGLDTDDHTLTIAFNHVGERLAQVGIEGLPNVFQRPIDVLDINYTWHLTDRLDIKASAGNLLNTTIKLTQQLEGGPPEVFREFENGRSFSLGASYTF